MEGIVIRYGSPVFDLDGNTTVIVSRNGVQFYRWEDDSAVRIRALFKVAQMDVPCFGVPQEAP